MPVKSWPSMAKAKRTELARDDAQGQASAADRASARPLRPAGEPGPARRTRKPAAEPQPSWPQHAAAVDTAVDHDRRRRREEALADRPVMLPARLGDAFRLGNLFLITDDDTTPESSAGADAEGAS
jgi:hypothetical protein